MNVVVNWLDNQATDLYASESSDPSTEKSFLKDLGSKVEAFNLIGKNKNHMTKKSCNCFSEQLE